MFYKKKEININNHNINIKIAFFLLLYFPILPEQVCFYIFKKDDI